jgi:hypothetical protein
LNWKNLVARDMLGELGEKLTGCLRALGCGHRLAAARIGGDLIAKARERHDTAHLRVGVGLTG